MHFNIMKKSQVLNYIGIFLITLGLSVIMMRFFDTYLSQADFIEEDKLLIYQSKLTENFTVENFNELIEESSDLAKSCQKELELDKNASVSDFWGMDSTNKTLCISEKRKELDKLKEDAEIQEIVDTYSMLNMQFEDINNTLEQIVSLLKETGKYSEGYRN